MHYLHNKPGQKKGPEGLVLVFTLEACLGLRCIHSQQE